MRSNLVAIASIYLVVATAEVTLHWYMGTQDGTTARYLQDAYFYRDPQNGKAYRAGLVVLILPAISFGIACGIFGARWSFRNLALCVVTLSLGMVALYPLYAMFFADGQLEWWPSTRMERAGMLIKTLIKTLCLCGVFAYGCTLLAQHFRDQNT